MKIYIDESGSTGHDYVNEEQPFFTISVNWMNDTEWDLIRSGIFGAYQGEELKFSKIIRSGAHAEKIKSFIEFLSKNRNTFCSYIVDKKSVLLEKFVMDCIEPTLFKLGEDIMENWRHIGVRKYIKYSSAF